MGILKSFYECTENVDLMVRKQTSLHPEYLKRLSSDMAGKIQM